MTSLTQIITEHKSLLTSKQFYAWELSRIQATLTNATPLPTSPIAYGLKPNEVQPQTALGLRQRFSLQIRPGVIKVDSNIHDRGVYVTD